MEYERAGVPLFCIVRVRESFRYDKLTSASVKSSYNIQILSACNSWVCIVSSDSQRLFIAQKETSSKLLPDTI